MEATVRATERHRTALRRPDLSRPVAAALRDSLLTSQTSFLDYGCGLGDDVRRLRKRGFECAGWDPVHQPQGARRESDVVNLGFVVNVIEDPQERVATLRKAWGFAKKLLVVAARLDREARPDIHDQYADGLMTSWGTFQKFHTQDELRDWIDSTLETKSVPAGPGIFYVFRSAQERESFVASRYRTRQTVPGVRKSDEIYEANDEILEPLRQFLGDRGRLPDPSELDVVPEIEERIGSLRRAFRVIERVTGVEDWHAVRRRRAEELLIYLALLRFGGRPKLSELPQDIRLDVRVFFRSYKTACEDADELLFAAGDMDVVDAACRGSEVGKCAGPALYVHQTALGDLPSVLRVYEGCARAYIGTIEGANLLKLHRREPQISYLAYPQFEREPHPALERSLTVHLQTFRLREIDYSERENPPILHRKEEFVGAGFPGREKFARLTQQEERAGLFQEATRIGTRNQWAEALKGRGVSLSGHRLVRADSKQNAGMG